MQTKAATKPSYTSQTSQYQPSTRQIQPVPPSTASSTSSSQPMVRQSSKDEPDSRKGSTDASALPTSVSWANPNATVIRTRRASQAASRSSPSPQISNATVASQKPEEPRQDETSNTQTNPPPQASSTPPVPSPENNASSKVSSVRGTKKEPWKRRDSLLDELIASVSSPEFRFVFNDSAFSPEELTALERHSVMIDPYGGAKLRVKREREEAERAKQEAEAQVKAQAASQIQTSENEEAVEDEPFESGSLALGGEPEDNPRSVAARSAIQRPSQPTSTNTFLNDQFSTLNGRSLTPHQRQQMSLINSSTLQQAPGLGHPMGQPFSAGAFEYEQRSGLSQAQAHHDSFHGHARQHSRFNFSNDSAKPNTTRYPTQQPSAGSQHFYTSGVQGPPPGLKTAGTPPISGGGMFAQGHGFTSNMGAGFGTVKESNTDMHMRGRSGTNTGHDISKREYLLSLQNTNLRSPPPSAPAPGLLNSLYGQYAGAYQDPGLVKQKKKGKKHRHANTSSSGGGVVDLADPSILQARLHQSGAGAGQGLFGGQNQGGYSQSNMAYGGGYGRGW
jgi:CCR4-NOT transcription complex subunit 4